MTSTPSSPASISPDELEAQSVRYGVLQAVVRLTSGNFAIFSRGPSGFTLLHIGPWEDIKPHVLSTEDAVQYSIESRAKEVARLVPSLHIDLELDL